MSWGAKVEVVTAPVLNHAMVQAGMGFCRRIVVQPLAPLGRESQQIEVGVEAALLDPFGEVVTRPWTSTEADWPGSTRWTLIDPSIVAESAWIAGLPDECRCEIRVRVRIGGEVVAETHTPIRVLGSRQWSVVDEDTLLSLELLAAFVQPNDPALQPLLGRAAEILAEQTGSGSLQTRERSGERIDQIVGALARAVHDHGVFYAEPPASWRYGQRVRTPGEVLEGQLGTCLDTTVLLASAMEQLGIDPVIWIASGHAFVGWWKGPDRASEAASTDVLRAVNSVDLDWSGVLETTMLTQERRPPRDLVRRVFQAPRDSYLHQQADRLIGVVDIAMARLLRIYPLPARRRREDGVLEVVEYRARPREEVVEPAGPRPAAPGSTVAGTDQRTEPPARVRTWQNALLDLTLRNRLLNSATGTGTLPLLLPPDHLTVLSDQLLAGRSIILRAVDDLVGALQRQSAKDAFGLPHDILRSMLAERATVFSHSPSTSHDWLLDRLRQRAKAGREETGSNPLVLTLGRLVWRLGERELAAPLLLLPVEIRGVVKPYRLAVDEAGEVTVNLSLLEKLRHEFGLTVPGLVPLPRRDDGEVDVVAVVAAVRTALAAHDLDFRVTTDAQLMISGFTGYLLWRDLDEHWESFCEMPLVRHLVAATGETFDSGTQARQEVDLDAVVARLPVPADSSQASAVAAAAAGESFVLEGPPGTGKSQTITNVIADQLRAGRSVLFVAEKGAALDVVRRRLDEIGLSPFVLDLHDRNARPTAVRQQLRRSLNHLVEPDLAGFQAAGQRLVASGRMLSDYRDALHRPDRLDTSLWTAHQLLLAHGSGPELDLAALIDAGPEAADQGRALIGDAVTALAALTAEDATRWGFAESGSDDPQLLADASARARLALGELDTLPAGHLDVLGCARDPGELDALATLLAAPGDLADIGSQRWRATLAEIGQLRTDLDQQAAGLWSRFDPQVLDLDLRRTRSDLREAAGSFFIGRGRRLLRAGEPVLAHLQPGAEVAPHELPEIVERVLAARQTHLRLRAALRSMPGLGDLSPELNVVVEGDRVATELADATRLAELLAALPAQTRQRLLVERLRGGRAELGQVEQVRRAVRALTDVLGATAATEQSVRRWSDPVGLLARWRERETLGAEPVEADRALRRWVHASRTTADWPAALAAARWQLLSGAVAAADAPAGYERGLARAVLAAGWSASGFGHFDAAGQDAAVSRHLQAEQELRILGRQVLPAELLAARPFGPGSRLGAVGRLDREVNRSRGGLSVRQLVGQHGTVLQAVAPCLLVSPDSLARFVAPGAMTFDLVVFDEASQIRVADAVGALGRARAAVVAGDSLQMPPTSFGDVTREDEDPDHVPDEESILTEAVQAGLPRRWLSWHYRSRDEALISFSNQQYYDDRLATFPSYWSQVDDTGLSFTRVDGHFHRSRDGRTEEVEGPTKLRTNPIEAAVVVEEVLRRWRQRERSIGVVTFNVQQRELIHDLLWDSGEPGVAEALAGESEDEGLFVKNLENVQGDERDVVIFSTGFSAAANGVLPLNFGPLNRVGGERRLNVAITRARRRVMVFSSFDPEDLRVEQTSAVGLHHLRAYLALARDQRDARQSVPGPTDRHREQIAEALRARGCEVRTEVGRSDFRIDLLVASAPGRTPRLAVLLDGTRWAVRPTVADRDTLPITVLQDMMGWPAVARVWLPSWLADPEAVLDRLVAAAEEARSRLVRAGSLLTTAETVPDPDPEPELAGETASEPDVVPVEASGPGWPLAPTEPPVDPDSGPSPFAEAVLERRPTSRLDRVGVSDSADRQVADLMREIVAQQGPLSVEALHRQVVRAHGLSRLTGTRSASLTPLLPRDLLRDDEGFVWPSGRDPLTWLGYRTSDDPRERPLTEVALRELGNVMVDLTRAAMGIEVDDLFRETARVFGLTRVTAPIRDRLEKALATAERQERLGRHGATVRVL